MTGIDPAEVARKVFRVDELCSWNKLAEAIRAALEQAWLEGWNDGREQWSDGEFVHALTDNPYAKGGKS